MPPPRLSRHSAGSPRRLASNEHGLAIIEFALVAAPFIALLLAIAESALVYFTQEALETGVEAAARTLITGQTQSNDAMGAAAGMTPIQLQARFQANACAKLPAFLSCSSLLVDVQSYSAFNQASMAPPSITYDSNGNITNSWNYNIGGAGSIVVVRLMYIWPVPPGPLGLDMSNLVNKSGKRLLMATSIAKSEPYS